MLERCHWGAQGFLALWVLFLAMGWWHCPTSEPPAEEGCANGNKAVAGQRPWAQ